MVEAERTIALVARGMFRDSICVVCMMAMAMAMAMEMVDESFRIRFGSVLMSRNFEKA